MHKKTAIEKIFVKITIFDDRGLKSMTSKASKCRHLRSNDVKVSDATEFSKFDANCNKIFLIKIYKFCKELNA